jgi:CxxC motif-containing protein (DUF1111 family)
MIGSTLSRIGRWVGLGICVALASWLLWLLTPGVPVLHGPAASAEYKEAGLTLFEHEWKQGDPMAKGDGLGPVFNARSCATCHFQGGVGGGGDIAHNITAFEVHPVKDRPEVEQGIVHAFSISKDCQESRVGLNDFFKIVPGGLKIVGGCTVIIRDFDPVRTDSINSTALFGAGWIERISTKTILQRYRTRTLKTLGKELLASLDGVKPGRPRVLPDGRIGKFGWKAQFATLQEFVASACANELGLGNPLMEQAKPYTHHASAKVTPDLDETQFASLVSFVDTLPRPRQVLPGDASARAMAERGKAAFEKIGCAICHTPEIAGVTGVYSDFLLHRLSDPVSEGRYGEVTPVPLPDDHPLPDEWKTPALWGVADSAPYFHDGRTPTLREAIFRHEGDARSVTKAFEGLPEVDQNAIISFLNTLKAPTEGKPAPAPRPRAVLASAR